MPVLGFLEYAPWDLNPESADQERHQAGFGWSRIVAEDFVLSRGNGDLVCRIALWTTIRFRVITDLL